MGKRSTNPIRTISLALDRVKSPSMKQVKLLKILSCHSNNLPIARVIALQRLNNFQKN